MKKVYKKPTMQVIELRQQSILLYASQDGKYVPVSTNDEESITDEKQVW